MFSNCFNTFYFIGGATWKKSSLESIRWTLHQFFHLTVLFFPQTIALKLFSYVGQLAGKLHIVILFHIFFHSFSSTRGDHHEMKIFRFPLNKSKNLKRLMNIFCTIFSSRTMGFTTSNYPDTIQTRNKRHFTPRTSFIDEESCSETSTSKPAIISWLFINTSTPLEKQSISLRLAARCALIAALNL